MTTIYTVIMAGGQGTRFWPKSRQNLPKQFLSLFGEESLLQTTYQRLLPFAPAERCLVLTDQRYGDLVQAQLPELPVENKILEPANRDTAACIGLAVAKICKRHPDAVLAVFPADHHIEDTDRFRQAVSLALQQAAETDDIVTIGVQPTYPAEGYGYLKIAQAANAERGKRLVFPVSCFVEKPCRTKAETFLAAGNYFWNSGMFFFKASVMRQALALYMPVLYQGLEALFPLLDTPSEQDVLQERYQALPKLSLDYAVMEKAEHISMVIGNFVWDDVGSWQALERYLPQDRSDNRWQGELQPIFWDSESCTVVDDTQLVATLGVQNLLVVSCGNVLLIAAKERSQEVKQLVSEIARRGQSLYL